MGYYVLSMRTIGPYGQLCAFNISSYMDNMDSDIDLMANN